MATYGGISLLASHDGLEALLDAYHRKTKMMEFEGVNSQPDDIKQLPFNGVEAPKLDEIGRLVWPQGASRFAYAHFIVDDTRLTQIRTQAYNGGVLTALPLVLSSGNTVTAGMYMLAPRPISQSSGQNCLWLLTLVDDRYWWWYKYGTLTVTEGTTTWSDLIDQVGTILGISITKSSIDSAFGKPTDRFESSNQPIPIILDNIASAIGQRIVRRYNGDVFCRNVTDSVTDFDANYDTHDPLLSTKRAFGGKFYISKGVGAASGDIFGTVPNNVRVLFPYSLGDNAYDGLHPVDVVASYSPDTAASSTKQLLWGDMFAIASGYPAPPTTTGNLANSTAISNCASALGQEWYKWHTTRAADISMAGVYDWTPEGFSDIVEYRWDGGNYSTRVTYGPRNDRATGADFDNDVLKISTVASGYQTTSTVPPTGFTGTSTLSKSLIKSLKEVEFSMYPANIGDAAVSTVLSATPRINPFQVWSLTNNSAQPYYDRKALLTILPTSNLNSGVVTASGDYYAEAQTLGDGEKCIYSSLRFRSAVLSEISVGGDYPNQPTTTPTKDTAFFIRGESDDVDFRDDSLAFYYGSSKQWTANTDPTRRTETFRIFISTEVDDYNGANYDFKLGELDKKGSNRARFYANDDDYISLTSNTVRINTASGFGTLSLNPLGGTQLSFNTGSAYTATIDSQEFRIDVGRYAVGIYDGIYHTNILGEQFAGGIIYSASATGGLGAGSFPYWTGSAWTQTGIAGEGAIPYWNGTGWAYGPNEGAGTLDVDAILRWTGTAWQQINPPGSPGAILITDAGNTPTWLVAGAAGAVLTMGMGGLPEWA